MRVLLAMTALLLACGAVAAPELSSFLQRAGEIEDWLISTRRTLHRFPELLFTENKTSAAIRQHLDDLGISYKCVAGESPHLPWWGCGRGGGAGDSAWGSGASR